MGFLYPEQAIIQLLEADATVDGLISGRIYGQIAAEDAVFPFGIYSRLPSDYTHHMKGSAQHLAAVIQYEWYAETYQEAKVLAEAVRVAIDGYRGVVFSGSNDVNIKQLFLSEDQDLLIEPLSDRDETIHGVAQIFNVHVPIPQPNV